MTSDEIVERVLDEERCPFCGHDPFHYVDIGVGVVPVAVTCCEFGVMLFQDNDELAVRLANDLRVLSQRILKANEGKTHG